MKILKKKVKLIVRVQIIAWLLYWIFLLILNLAYFRNDDYPTPLLILWTILFTICGALIFFSGTKLYGYLARQKTGYIRIIIFSVVFSFAGAYIWGLFEPIISWAINENITELNISFDINKRGTFGVFFILAFFSMIFFYFKQIEQSVIQKNSLSSNTEDSSVSEKTISVYVKNKIILLPIRNIKRIFVNGNYTTVIDNKNTEYKLKKTLKKWEDELQDFSFIRIHRSTIINANYIDTIELWHNYTYKIHLKGIDQPEYTSRRYSSMLKKQLDLKNQNLETTIYF